jgi:hypothetical protein
MQISTSLSYLIIISNLTQFSHYNFIPELMRKRKATEGKNIWWKLSICHSLQILLYILIVQDVSAQVLDVFNKRTRVALPKVDKLADFLEQPLLHNMKIPILQHEYNSYLIQSMENMCTPEDLNILFRISDTENAYKFITKTLGAPIRNNPPSRKGTDYSFVLFWDINIRFPLEQFIHDSISIRNSSQKMSTFGKRPDFGFILPYKKSVYGKNMFCIHFIYILIDSVYKFHIFNKQFIFEHFFKKLMYMKKINYVECIRNFELYIFRR